ncbi:D-ribose pyranase [Blautia sp.]|uniref:D-ribose pyranase n=1 Tax=Blautia sp. TaxID=1955243 RepID=UPI0025873282|nr:D-ribose pyranase [Blautia sp.]
MRKEGILNTDICCAISSLGHTDYLVIADPGLPIPDHVTVIDISLVKGVPGFTEVFDAVTEELVIDSYIYAEEMESSGAELLKYVQDKLAGVPAQKIPHEDLKHILPKAKVIIRTGECTPYANVILEGGVNF